MKNLKQKLFYAVFIALTAACLTSCNCHSVENSFAYKAEQAYFEGQKDALNGDVRIKRNQDSCWIWIRSPWDSGKPPKFYPSFDCK